MFSINEQLLNDTHYLVEKNGFHLLLHKNASIPWLIIVPVTDVIEVFDLSQSQQQDLNDLIKEISTYLQQKFTVTKMNIAAIGNIVSQLHIHVIGRKKGDACWPDVVWGNEYPFVEWSNEKLNAIKQDFKSI
jgi:diadenosine tetraphosphate (Ap4A) HIT family hydrolase